MSTIDVAPEDLKRWAKGLLEMGVSMRTRLEGLADAAENAEVNRQKNESFAAFRGFSSSTKLNPAVLNLSAALHGLGSRLDGYAQSLTAALEGSAAAVSAHDTKTESAFAGKTVVVVRK